MDQAKELLHRHRIEKLLVIDGEGRSRADHRADIEQAKELPVAAVDIAAGCGSARGRGRPGREAGSRR